MRGLSPRLGAGVAALRLIAGGCRGRVAAGQGRACATRLLDQAAGSPRWPGGQAGPVQKAGCARRSAGPVELAAAASRGALYLWLHFARRAERIIICTAGFGRDLCLMQQLQRLATPLGWPPLLHHMPSQRMQARHAVHPHPSFGLVLLEAIAAAGEAARRGATAGPCHLYHKRGRRGRKGKQVKKFGLDGQ